MKDTSEYTGFLFEAQQLNSRADYSRKIRIKKQRNFKLPYQTAHAHTHLKQTRARENSSLKNWLKSENITKKLIPLWSHMHLQKSGCLCLCPCIQVSLKK